jgi:inhibitor of growth protein 4
MGQTKEQIKYVLGVPSYGYDRPNMDDDDSAMEKMKKDIEASQDNALSLCTEKVLLARQAYDLVLLFLSFRSSLVSSGLMITRDIILNL